MNGIAISFYDKFDELAVLVDIIRHNWDEEYYIVVSSKHSDAVKKLDTIDIDEFVSGGEIEYSPDEGDSTVAKHDGWINLTSRVLDSIKFTCQAAIEADCDYVMHLHADAWPLEEDNFLRLTDHLDGSDDVLAMRGDGMTFRRPDYHLGRVMDQFFVFDAQYFDDISFFDYNPLELLPHTSVHTSLMLLFLGRVGLSNIWHYSDMSNDVYWDGEPKIRPFSGVRPSVLDPDWGLLHVATDEFPEDLGKSVQAMYLNRYGLTSGEHISSYIEQYERDEAGLFAELAAIEERQNRELRRLGYRPNRLGRLFTQKEQILSKSLNEKAKTLLKNIAIESYYAAFSVGYRLYYSAFGDGEADHPNLDVHTRGFYKDAMWPRTLEEYYTDRLIRDDFPNEYLGVWVDDVEARTDHP